MLSKIHEVFLNVSGNFSPIPQLLQLKVLEDDGAVHPGAMILITNPVSFFKKIKNPNFKIVLNGSYSHWRFCNELF